MAAAATVAVAPEQIERRVFRDRVELSGVRGVHLVDVVHRHAGDRRALGQRLCELDLDRVHACDVMHDNPDLAPILEERGLPLLVGEGVGRRGQCASPFETVGKCVSTLIAK